MEQGEAKQIEKILTDGEEIVNLVNSRGWAIVENKLLDKIIELGDIMSFDDTKDLTVRIAASQEATKLLIEWLEDVKGDAQRHKLQGMEYIKARKKEAFIKILE